MSNVRQVERVQAIVIGGGQAGLSVGYHLQKRGISFVILEANERIGDTWRTRWDSLRLFTPARFDSIPGMPFPAPTNELPTKEQMADYLESYAKRFELPVRTGVVVWCTGFHAGSDSWIDLPIFGDDGEPVHERGVVSAEPGLYFMGLHFLYAMSSTMIHGIGRDAEYIADKVVARVRASSHAESRQLVPALATGH